MTLQSYWQMVLEAVSVADCMVLSSGELSYKTNCISLVLMDIKLEYGDLLSQHMTQQEVQCFKVAKETMVEVKADLDASYYNRAQASEVLSRLGNSSIDMKIIVMRR